jgi:hypothetical protein
LAFHKTLFFFRAERPEGEARNPIIPGNFCRFRKLLNSFQILKTLEVLVDPKNLEVLVDLKIPGIPVDLKTLEVPVNL